VALILATAGIRSMPVGVVLWPAAVVLHSAMAIWCIVSLRALTVAATTADSHPDNLAMT